MMTRYVLNRVFQGRRVTETFLLVFVFKSDFASLLAPTFAASPKPKEARAGKRQAAVSQAMGRPGGRLHGLHGLHSRESSDFHERERAAGRVDNVDTGERR